jgi:prepilin-type N-terminal cleavage/methylation domain-containing protein
MTAERRRPVRLPALGAGFTLLELLMVVVIISILTSMALPQYIRAAEKARAVEALQLLGAIRSAQNRYKVQSPGNVFALVITDLDTEMPAGGTRAWGAVPTLNATTAVFTRNAGVYIGQTLGLRYDNGMVCGNFAPMGVPACP